MRKSRLAFFVGDPNGVGPELAAKLLARPETRAAAGRWVIEGRR